MINEVGGPDVSFEEAQKLYSTYLPLNPDQMLYNDLVAILGEDRVAQYKGKSVREIYNEIMMQKYPNEYAIKASFINKVLLRGKSHVSIFELNVGSSRVDLCKINGTSIAYEIKTDLDNFNRLDKQLNDYLQVFEEVYVICSNSRVDKVKVIVPEEVGIYVYTIRNGKYVFRKEQVAQVSNRRNPIRQLELFTKKELLNRFGNKIPEEIRDSKEQMREYILSNILPDKINSELKKCLKNRYERQWCFLRDNHERILEIDYQWFFKMPVEPEIIYNVQKSSAN